MRSPRIFSRPTPGYYPVKANCVRKKLSPPRTVHRAPRVSATLLDSINSSHAHPDFARQHDRLMDVQSEPMQDGGEP